MNTAPKTAVTAADRLGLMLFVALAAHAIVILGISFDLLDEAPDRSLPTLEITLVAESSREAPEQADYLAQANSVGGGETAEKTRPSSPLPAPAPAEPTPAPAMPEAAPPAQQPEQPSPELLAAERAPEAVPAATEDKEPVPKKPPVDSNQLMERSREIARLTAELQERQQAYQQQPRRTYISGANAREYRLASYMEAWRAKVERIGNLNYPDEAYRRKLSGSLLLDVAIGPDGSVSSVRLLRSSGHQVLDDAALRIVELAAPFAPLPQDIRKDTDILHIIRTWNFENSQGLQTVLQ